MESNGFDSLPDEIKEQLPREFYDLPDHVKEQYIRELMQEINGHSQDTDEAVESATRKSGTKSGRKSGVKSGRKSGTKSGRKSGTRAETKKRTWKEYFMHHSGKILSVAAISAIVAAYIATYGTAGLSITAIYGFLKNKFGLYVAKKFAANQDTIIQNAVNNPLISQETKTIPEIIAAKPDMPQGTYSKGPTSIPNGSFKIPEPEIVNPNGQGPTVWDRLSNLHQKSQNVFDTVGTVANAGKGVYMGYSASNKLMDAIDSGDYSQISQAVMEAQNAAGILSNAPIEHTQKLKQRLLTQCDNIEMYEIEGANDEERKKSIELLPESKQRQLNQCNAIREREMFLNRRMYGRY